MDCTDDSQLWEFTLDGCCMLTHLPVSIGKALTSANVASTEPEGHGETRNRVGTVR